MSEDPWRQYGKDLIGGYVGWFWDQVNELEKKYLRCFWTGLVFSLLATMFAAMPKTLSAGLTLHGEDLVGWLVVVFSSLATFFNVTLVPRYKGLLDDRDKGRIRLDTIRQRFEVANFATEARQELDKMIGEIAAVENDLGGVTKMESAPFRKE